MATRTYVLIDGENLDATLSTAILHHAPKSSDRPRWERVLEFAHGLGSQDVIRHFFINPSRNDTPWPFVAAIQNAGFRAILLAGTGPASRRRRRPADLETLVARDCDVLVGS